MVLLRRRVALRMKLRCSCCGRWWCVEGNFQKRMSGEIKLEVVASAVTSQQSDALKKKEGQCCRRQWHLVHCTTSGLPAHSATGIYRSQAAMHLTTRSIRHCVHCHKQIDLALLGLTGQVVCINNACVPDGAVRRLKRRTNPSWHPVATQKPRTG